MGEIGVERSPYVVPRAVHSVGSGDLPAELGLGIPRETIF
jgi:hypothetical protein